MSTKDSHRKIYILFIYLNVNFRLNFFCNKISFYKVICPWIKTGKSCEIVGEKHLHE